MDVRQARRGDGRLLRELMIEAATAARLDLEQRAFFSSRPDEVWEETAVDRCAPPGKERALFVAVDGRDRGVGVLWCFAGGRVPSVGYFGWWWVDPVIVGTDEEVRLVEAASAWAVARGANVITTTASNDAELGYCRRTGFVRSGTAFDGKQPVYVRLLKVDRHPGPGGHTSAVPGGVVDGGGRRDITAEIAAVLRVLPAGAEIVWGSDYAGEDDWIDGWCDIWVAEIARPLGLTWVWTVRATPDEWDDPGERGGPEAWVITLAGTQRQGSDAAGWTTAEVSAALQEWTTTYVGRWDLRFRFEPNLNSDWALAMVERYLRGPRRLRSGARPTGDDLDPDP